MPSTGAASAPVSRHGATHGLQRWANFSPFEDKDEWKHADPFQVAIIYSTTGRAANSHATCPSLRVRPCQQLVR
jgi:hypothetical protein